MAVATHPVSESQFSEATQNPRKDVDLALSRKEEDEQQSNAIETSKKIVEENPKEIEEEAVFDIAPSSKEESVIAKDSESLEKGPKAKSLDIRYNDTGYSYDSLFAEYLEGAKLVEIQEPYLSNGYQLQDLTRFAETVVKVGDCKKLSLTTKVCDTPEDTLKVQDGLDQLKAALEEMGVDFEYTFSDIIHARYIETDTGWNISLDRGLHIYQPIAKNYYLMGYYELALRPCKETKIIYTRVRL